MDVRCERCRVQYVFSEDQVGADGLTVRCSNCGHVFLVKKKALVVTVPVKPGELREAPVPTADLDRASPAPAGPPARPAAERPAAERERPWTLRNLRGDLYPFKELSTLQKWIVERKAARDDEVSHLGGAWRRLGDMLELEPFFALVERAERAAVPAPRRAEPDRAPAPAEPLNPPAQPTLIDFPASGPTFPGPAHQPEPAKTDRFPFPAEANRAEPTLDAGPYVAEGPDVSLGSAPVAVDEGPVFPAKLGPVSGAEPAWTAGSGQRPVEPAKARPAARKGRRAGALPLLVLLLAAAAAAVYFTNPGWLGLIASVRPAQDAPPPKPEPASPAPAPQAEPTPPARERTPSAPAEGAVPGTPAARPAPPSSGTPPATSSNAAPPNPNLAPPVAPPAPPPAPSAAAAAPGPAAPTSDAPPASAAAAEGPRSPRPPGEAPPSASAQSSAEPAPAAAPKEAPAAPAGRAAQAPKAEAPPRRPAAVAQATEPRKPGGGGLKRLLADGRRLRLRGKPDVALRTYGQAVELDATNADALAGRGLCYLDLSRYEPAEASFQAALEADPRHAEALMGLAETYRYEGRRTEAVTYYQRYVAAHPDGEDAAAARNAIDALKE